MPAASAAGGCVSRRWRSLSWRATLQLRSPSSSQASWRNAAGSTGKRSTARVSTYRAESKSPRRRWARAEKRERLAGRRGRRYGEERFDRFVERHRIRLGFGDLEPNPAEGGVRLRLIGVLLSRAAEGQHGHVGLPGARIGKTARHVASGMCPVQRHQRIQLFQFLPGVTPSSVHRREGLPRLQERR